MKLIDRALAMFGLRRINKPVHIRMAPISPETASAYAAATRRANQATRHAE